MIPRILKSELLAQMKEFPIVTVLGPRQAGKTTLVRESLPDFDYVSLENPETMAIAQEGPRAFARRSLREAHSPEAIMRSKQSLQPSRVAQEALHDAPTATQHLARDRDHARGEAAKLHALRFRDLRPVGPQ